MFEVVYFFDFNRDLKELADLKLFFLFDVGFVEKALGVLVELDEERVSEQFLLHFALVEDLPDFKFVVFVGKGRQIYVVRF